MLRIDNVVQTMQIDLLLDRCTVSEYAVVDENSHVCG